MMIIAILQDRKFKDPVLSAVVSLEGRQVRVLSRTKVLSELIERILPYPTKIKERKDGVVTKRYPKNVTENLIATLKQNLYYPYRIANQEQDIDTEKFEAKYKKVYPTNVLYGEMRHESTREARRAAV